MQAAYLVSPTDLAQNLNSDLNKGLSSSQAQQNLLEFGPNVLKDKKGINPLILFLSQFTSFLVIILLIASGVSFFLGERFDALMIMAIVILNAIVGFIQQYRVEKAIEHLKKLVTSNVLVYRDSNLVQIPSTNLVLGDVIVLEEGQKVAADIRVISCFNLETIEAALTGESTPIKKTDHVLTGDLPIADQKNMLFSGTTISAGKGTGLVVATGMNTQLGKIAHLVASQEEPPTPLQQKLDRLGVLIGKIVLVIAAIVVAQEILFGSQIIEALISGVALAVAAIPEGLPAVVTISLALGTKRLLSKNALIRNLPAAETLGSTDIICSDKTGTLTEGVMSVRQIYLNDQIYQIDENKLKDSNLQKNLRKILEIGMLSSNARFSGEKIVGDPTEASLIKIAIDTNIDQLQLLDKYQRVHEVPFSSLRKMMTTVSQTDDEYLVTNKGATEVVLNLCTKIEKNGQIQNITEQDKQKILQINEQMASQALRVLAFSYKNVPKIEQNNLEKDLVFLGLQAMMDPPREGIAQTIKTCQDQAGIKVVMITGDHLLTALAIAKQIGIQGESITGVELDKLPDEEFEQKVKSISVYARVNPEHKIRIINGLKRNGHQVAMTGDGVNDAPALKAADIGVAMGITGTDVAKEASDMILLDDHFNTIVAAIKEGRAIYENIRKFVAYLLSANTMEVLVIFFAVIVGWPLPLLPIHLLWINLVTDGLPAIALGIDPSRADVMSSQPQQFRQEIINRKFLTILGLEGILISAVILMIFGYFKSFPLYAQTLAFTAVVVYEMLVIVGIRSQYKLSILSNKFLVLAVATSLILQLMVLYLPISIAGLTLQQLFKVQPLLLSDWLIILTGGIIILILMRFLIIRPQK